MAVLPTTRSALWSVLRSVISVVLLGALSLVPASLRSQEVDVLEGAACAVVAGSYAAGLPVEELTQALSSHGLKPPIGCSLPTASAIQGMLPPEEYLSQVLSAVRRRAATIDKLPGDCPEGASRSSIDKAMTGTTYTDSVDIGDLTLFGSIETPVWDRKWSEQGCVERYKGKRRPHGSYEITDGRTGQRQIAEYTNGSLRGDYALYKKGQLFETGRYGRQGKEGSWLTFDGGELAEARVFQAKNTWTKLVFAEGRLVELQQFADDTAAGWSVQWERSSGQPQSRERVEGNRTQGVKHTWHSNGQLATQGEYNTSGQQFGLHLAFNEQGQIQDSSEFIEGVLHGAHKSWKDGQLILEEYYREGKLDGKRQAWSAGGKRLVQESWDSGQPSGKRLHWHENGRKKLDESYKDGQLHGKRREWYLNGKTKVEENYRSGLLHGRHRTFTENATPLEDFTYQLGTLDGPYKKWMLGGTLKAVGSYSTGLKHGDWSGYSDQGVLQSKGRYIAGKKSGAWVFYDAKGTLVEEWEYFQGKKGKFVQGNAEVTARVQEEEIQRLRTRRKAAQFALAEYILIVVQELQRGMDLRSNPEMREVIRKMVREDSKQDRYCPWPTGFCEVREAARNAYRTYGFQEKMRQELGGVLPLDGVINCFIDSLACPEELIGFLDGANRRATASWAPRAQTLRKQLEITRQLVPRLPEGMARLVIEGQRDGLNIMVPEIERALAVNDMNQASFLISNFEGLEKPKVVEAARGIDIGRADPAALLPIIEELLKFDPEALERISARQEFAASSKWVARAPQAKKSGPCSNEKIPPEENKAQVYSYSNMGAKGGSSYSGELVCLSRTGGRDFGLQNAYVMCDAKDGWVDERSCTTFSGEAVYADYRSARRCTFR